jgi:hypothetical protein
MHPVESMLLEQIQLCHSAARAAYTREAALEGDAPKERAGRIAGMHSRNFTALGSAGRLMLLHRPSFTSSSWESVRAAVVAQRLRESKTMRRLMDR